MPIPRIVGLSLAAALVVAACSSSSSTTTTEPGEFLLPERLDTGVAEECVELADEFLGTMQEQVALLGSRSFAEWVTTGLFYVEDEAPELVAKQAEVTEAYAAAACPAGYLAASIVAHGGRFDLQSPAAAIWWASAVAGSLPDVGEEQAWLTLAGADQRDASSQVVVPDQDEVEAIAGCDELAAAATNLLQQQLYAVSAVPLGESLDDELEPLDRARERIEQLRSFSDCDAVVREVLLRQAHEIEFTGANAVVAYATELDASWTLWMDEMLMPELEIGVNLLDRDAGQVEVVVDNIGNIPMRVVSVDLAGVAVEDLKLDVLPDQFVPVELVLDPVPLEDVELTVSVQTPTGTTETLSAFVSIGSQG